MYAYVANVNDETSPRRLLFIFMECQGLKSVMVGEGLKPSCSHDQICPLNATPNDDVANMAKTLAPSTVALANHLAQQLT